MPRTPARPTRCRRASANRSSNSARLSSATVTALITTIDIRRTSSTFRRRAGGKTHDGLPRLRHVSSSEPGLARRRCGRGFTYVDSGGTRVDDAAVIARIRELAIPPAWTHVWICVDENGPSSGDRNGCGGATSVPLSPPVAGAARRREVRVDGRLRQSLPRLRREVDRLVAAPRPLAGPRPRLRHRTARPRPVQDRGRRIRGGQRLVRPRRPSSAQHVQLDGGGTLLFDYVGKGGKRHPPGRSRPAPLEVGAELKRLRRRDARFLAYRNGRGWVSVRSDDVNAFLKELAGERVLGEGLPHLARDGARRRRRSPPPTRRARSPRRNARSTKTLRTVADSLGNTPAVCRASYVDPRVFDAFRAGDTVAPTLKRLHLEPGEPLSRSEQETIERAVRRVLAAG